MLKAYLDRKAEWLRTDIYLRDDTYSYELDGNGIKKIAIEEGQALTPFMCVSDQILVKDSFFQALSDAFAQMGIYPTVTNKEKIKAEAISDERKEQIDYMRGLNERIIFKDQ